MREKQQIAGVLGGLVCLVKPQCAAAASALPVSNLGLADAAFIGAELRLS